MVARGSTPARSDNATGHDRRRLIKATHVALRSVPLIAMTPLLALVFGNGTLLIATVAGTVVLVPTVVTVTAGLANVPTPAVNLLHAYGARPRATLLKLRLPFAIPALFASARVAMPGAIVGAVLAEWL